MRIEPLSKETLKGAMEMLNKVFPVQTKRESSDYWLPKSISGSYKKSRYPSVRYCKYWVAVEDGKVVGITGLYSLEEDWKDALWLSWFCVDPSCRGRGLGTKLLDLAIENARKEGKKFLRLYTSPDDPNESAAQKLYEKRGFVITKKNVEKRGKFSISYRELKL
jgi:ribosomal protein S18 acetylase RimI-like enzyme